MNEEKMIQMDRMRYTQNSLSSGLALLAILFNVFYFVSIYKSDVGSYYYNILIGASIIYNLVFMLATFLASEGVKNYKVQYSWLLIVIGVLQVVRIFILPRMAHEAVVTVNKVSVVAMQDGQFIRVVIYLILSAVCCLAAAVIGIQKSHALNAYMKLRESGQA